MRKVTVVTTNNSQVNQFEVEAGVSTFSQLVTALPAVDFSNKTVTVGKALYSLEHPDAILPEGNLKVFISPKDMKAAFPAEYYEIRNKLRDYRADAVKNDDDEILNLIGNYTHDSVNVMKAKVEDVEALLAEREEEENKTKSEFYVAPQPASWVNLSSTEDRLFEIEYALGIRNSSNAQRFNQRALEEAKNATKK
jgi:hypothetical protein